jgi:hypothetical protein
MTRMDAVFTFGATGTTTTDYICAESGFAEIAIVKVPNFTNAITVTISVKDTDGNVLWTKAAIAKNGSVKFGADIETAKTGCIPIGDGYKISCVLSGVAGGTGGIVHAFFYVED